MSDSIPDLPGIDIRGTIERLGLDYEDLRGIYESLPDGALEKLAEAEAAVATGDNVAARNAAHALAGMAGNFGLFRVHPAAKSVEAAAKEGRGADLPALVATLRPLVEEVVNGLRKN